MQTSTAAMAAQGARNPSESQVSWQTVERSVERSRELGKQMVAMASDLLDVGRQIKVRDVSGFVAHYVEQTAALVDRLGTYLRATDNQRLVGDLEKQARRQPLVVAATGLMLGFAVSRFIKPSSPRGTGNAF